MAPHDALQISLALQVAAPAVLPQQSLPICAYSHLAQTQVDLFGNLPDSVVAPGCAARMAEQVAMA